MISGKRLGIGLLLAALLSGGVATPALADTPTPQQTIINDINTYRASLGIAPVVVDTRVTNVAQDWANRMHDAGYPSHNPNLLVSLDGASGAGEATSQLYDEHTVATKWWLDNSHKSILMGARWSKVGIGYVHDPVTDFYWIVADFAAYPTSVPDAGVPAKPAVPTVALQGTSLAVTVTPSTDTAVTMYAATLYDTTGAVVQSSYLARGSLTYTFTNLTPGESYTVKINAYNGAGESPLSDASTTVSLPNVVPDDVTRVNLIKYGPKAVLASWWGVDAHGATASGYTANLYRDGNLVDAYAGNRTTTSHIFAELTDGGTYTVSVYATGVAGNSTPVTGPALILSISTAVPVTVSDIPSVNLTPQGPTAPVNNPVVVQNPGITTSLPTPVAPVQVVPTPVASVAPVANGTPVGRVGAPTTVSVSQPNEFSATVRWTKSSTSSDVQNYVVTMQPQGSTVPTVVRTVTGVSSSTSFTNLIPNMRYTAQVTAVGVSNQATTVADGQPVTLADVTLAPTAAQFLAPVIAKKSLQLRWAAAKTNGGGKVVGYTVIVKGAGVKARQYQVGSMNLGQKLTGLRVNSTYTVTLSARNSAGKVVKSVATYRTNR